MIYFFNNDLGLEKVVTSSNTLVGNHEHELNNLIRADVVLDLEHALSFIDDVDFFGYYYKDVFYLHKITREESEHEAEVMVLAGRHIFFEDMLYSEVIKDIRPQNRDAKYMLDQAIGGFTRWNVVMTDATGTLSTNFYWQMPYEALEWIVEHFRLEYLPVILFDGQKINGYELHVKKRLGENKGIRIPWGERVEKLNYEVDYSDIVTQLAPRGKGEEIGEDIYGRRINISDVSFSRNGVVSPIGNLYLEDKNLTAKYGNDGGKPRKGEGEFYDIDDVNELAEAGYQMYLDVSRPQVVISADVVDIGDVTIGDGVNIIRREHDLYFEARVHKISVDLLNPDDAQIELGDYEHFKESKIQKSNNRRIETIEREFQGIIHQYKIEFDENFDGVVNQWREEFLQALIDVHAEIKVAEERMERLISTTRNEWTETFDAEVAEIYRKADEDYNRIETEIMGTIDSTRSEMESEMDSKVSDAREYADSQIADKEAQYEADWNQRDADIQQIIETVVGGSIESLDTNLLDVNSRLLSKLEESDLQPLYGRIDDAFSDISDVSENLNTTRSELQGQLDDAFSDISDVSGDLSSARESLQEQLDEARADLEGMEVGGANLLPAFTSDKWTHTNLTEIEDYSLYFPSGHAGHSIIFIDVEKHSNYTMTFNSDYSRYYIYEVLEDESLGSIIRTRTGSETYTFNTGDISKIRVSINTFSGNVQEEKNIWNLKLEKGTFSTDWTPAPEDVEEKITTLSESIEYIDGQLEAKLNRTEIEPIQNKITEYGTTLDANAESIGLLQDKIQLHDDDIEQWSNQATSTAEEVSRILTHNSEQDDLITSVTNESRETAEGLERVISRVSETESGISIAQADINANANLISTTMTRVDENDRAIGDFQATADGLKADFARYQSDFGDDISDIQSQVASYETNVDGFRAELVTLQGNIDDVDSWMAEKGAVIDGNADAIRMRVWQQDIDSIEIGGRNLIWNSKEFTRSPANSGFVYININDFTEELIEGQEYTFSSDVEIAQGDFDAITVLTRKTNGNSSGEVGNLSIVNGRIECSFIAREGDGRLYVYMGRSGQTHNNQAIFRNVKLEKGNKATDWTPAPEDTEAKITQLNTDVNIEAGRINALLTRTSSAENSIADINLSVDGITAEFADYKRDVGVLSAQVASYEASVDGFRADVGQIEDDMLKEFSIVEQRFDSITNQVSNIRINTRNMLQGSDFSDMSLITLYGDAFLRIGGDENYAGHIRMGPSHGTNTTSFQFRNLVNFEAGVDYYLVLEYRTLAVRELDYLQLEREDGTFKTVFEGDTEIEGFTNLKFGSLDWHKKTIRINFENDESGMLRIGTRFNRGNTVRGWIDIYQPYLTNTMNREWVPHPRDGQNIDELVDRVTNVEQTSESIRANVQKISNDALMRSDILIESNRILIGSQSIDSEELASIIAVSPNAINMITDELNLTGNLNVKGQIESISMGAVKAEFGSLWADEFSAITIDADDINGLTARFEWLYTLNANIEKLVAQHVFADGVTALVGNFVDVNAGNIVTSGLSANVILSSHINSSNALINKIFSNSARIDTLITKTHFANEIKAMSIDVVYANISDLRTKLLTSDVIMSRHVNASLALIDKIFSEESYIGRLTSKSAFIRDIQAIEITTNQLNINTLQNKLGSVEGGLSIYGPDGRVLINNSIMPNRFDVQFIQPHFMGSGVTTSANYFKTRNTSYSTAAAFSFYQAGRYLTIEGYCEMRGEVSGASRNTIGAIRLMEYSGGSRSSFTYINSRNDNNDSNQYYSITLDLGVPRYRQRNFYVQFYTANAQNGAYFRINQAYYHG